MWCVAAVTWILGDGGAGAWRDEIATLAVSTRTSGQILGLATHVDAVLAAYYLLVHAVAPGDLVGARAVSAVALATATALLLPLCRRIGAPAAGPWAAAFVVVSPVAARWAQEARPTSLAVLGATAATLALATALGDGRARWWVAYGLTLAALGYLQLTALLLVPAHAVAVAVAGRAAWRRWAAAATAALLAVAPLVWVGAHERDAIAWITRPGPWRLRHLPESLLGPAPVVAVLAAVAALAVAASRRQPRAGSSPADGAPPADSARPADDARPRAFAGPAAFAVPWALLPPAGLWLAGQAMPLYTERYLVFCLPALAVLAGWALARAGRRAAATALVAVLVLAVPQQLRLRSETGHGEDVGRLLAVLDDRGRAGDAVVFQQQSSRLLAEAYPRVFAPLSDVTAGTSGAVAGTLGGSWPARPCGTIPGRVRGHHRVWVVASGRRRPDFPAAVAAAAMPDYLPVHSWRAPPYTLTLYVRGAAPPAGASGDPCAPSRYGTDL